MSFRKIVDHFGISILKILLLVIGICFCWFTLRHINDKASDYMKKEKKTFTILGRNSYDIINRNGYAENVKVFQLKSNDSIGELNIFVSDDVYQANLDNDTYTTLISKRDIDKSKGLETPYYGTFAFLLMGFLMVFVIFFFVNVAELVEDIVEYISE